MSVARFLLMLPTIAAWMCGVSIAQTPDFEKEIAPLLIRRCIECHTGSDPAGGLSLQTRDGLLAGGHSGDAIDGSTPDESLLLSRVVDGEMPPEKQGRSQKIPDDEVQLLTRWLQSGADWPPQRRLDLFERTNDLRAGRDWWSLQPIRPPQIPTVGGAVPDSPIDAFVLAKLDKAGMVPAPQADPATRLRRLYIDLIGLPPTEHEIETFVADPSTKAWEHTIDRLLQSPQYGVRWAQYWLDVVRYADTSGYERDQEKPFAWKYRDWVVDALNDDMSYDQFVVHQLAGDEIDEKDINSVIATGFLRLGTWNDEPNDPADYQYDRLEDLVHTTSTAFLGMTVKCARCHDHKFDAITQDDYYRMATAFWAGPIDRGGKTLGGPTSEELGFEDVLGWTDTAIKPEPLFALKNGERQHPLHEVVPATLSLLPELEMELASPGPDATTTTRRLQLAKWIVDPRNPITPRVLVNRLWQHHFGQGIVRTPNNFGFLCDPPTHPELLDWLAAEFVSGGWKIKRLHKMILMSATWQQASVHPRQDEYHSVDAGNRYIWRANRRRLDAETLRDAMLYCAGELQLQTGGVGFRPTISKEAL
ncbi:MAG: PSD1 domain-containing protein, partial [Planctomycetales bacterium]|nr:PSD1 domain-containing protein [Planctomycetales bacterium]